MGESSVRLESLHLPRRPYLGMNPTHEGHALAGDIGVKGADSTGFAQPVSLTSVVDSKNAQAPKLGERVIARASLKARQWKEQLAARPRGFFGSVRRPGTCPTPISPCIDGVHDTDHAERC